MGGFLRGADVAADESVCLQHALEKMKRAAGRWAALITSLLMGCLGFLTCPQARRPVDLTVQIFKDNAGEADVTEQIIIEPDSVPLIELTLE
jgi:hypothetical protein